MVIRYVQGTATGPVTLLSLESGVELPIPRVGEWVKIDTDNGPRIYRVEQVGHGDGIVVRVEEGYPQGMMPWMNYV